MLTGADFKVEAVGILRPVAISLLGVLVVAMATLSPAWGQAKLMLGVMMVLIGLVGLLQAHRQVGVLRERSDAARAAARQAEEHYVNVLHRIIRFTEQRDKGTQGRSDRIADLTERMARQMGLDEDRCSELHLAGKLHDIGMLAVPEHVLTKHAALSGVEQQIVRSHAEISYEVLRPLGMLWQVLPAIRHHHERMNGTGYPKALKGREIPLGARILAVSTAYDAMTHDRPHQPAVSPLESLRELRRCCPEGFDRDCVDALAEAVGLAQLEKALADEPTA